MILGRFTDTAENGGRMLMLDSHELSVEGHGPVDVADVAAADARGDIVWEQQAFRNWMLKRAAEAGWKSKTAEELPSEEVVPPAEAVAVPPEVEPPVEEAVAAAAAEPVTPPVSAEKRGGRGLFAIRKPAAEKKPRAEKPAKKPRVVAEKAPAKPKVAAVKPAPEKKAAAEPEFKRMYAADRKAERERKAAEKHEAAVQRAIAAGKTPPRARDPKPEKVAAATEKTPVPEGTKRRSPATLVAVGIIATLLFAAVMALALNHPVQQQPLPQVTPPSSAAQPAEQAATQP
jgi:hypothetical protein